MAALTESCACEKATDGCASVDVSKVPRTKNFEMPPGVKKIQAIWSHKRKHFPDGTLNKHKAQLCAHGGMQQWGVNY